MYFLDFSSIDINIIEIIEIIGKNILGNMFKKLKNSKNDLFKAIFNKAEIISKSKKRITNLSKSLLRILFEIAIREIPKAVISNKITELIIKFFIIVFIFFFST